MITKNFKFANFICSLDFHRSGIVARLYTLDGRAKYKVVADCGGFEDAYILEYDRRNGTGVCTDVTNCADVPAAIRWLLTRYTVPADDYWDEWWNDD